MATKTMDLGQVMGTSAYQEAQAGGYTGTKEEFQKELAGIGGGGGVFLVTIDASLADINVYTGTADHTPDEIEAAVSAGKIPVAYAVIGDADAYLYHVSSSDNNGAMFMGASDDGALVTLNIYQNKSIWMTSYPSAQLSDDAPAAPGTASAGNSNTAARADHVHPKEVSDGDRAAWNGKAAGTHASQHSSSGSDPITPDAIGAIPTSARGAKSGVASLGTDGKVPSSQLPTISSVKTYTATIGTNWTEDTTTGVKTQNVAISGVLSTHTATIDHAFTGTVTSPNYAGFVEAENQYLTCITNGYAETYNGGIKFTIFGDANTVSIPIVVEVA